MLNRSKCFSCSTTLKWYDLVPLMSFLFLRGHCRYCKSKVSIQYPLVEILTGLLFVLLFFVLPIDFSIMSFVVLLLYLVFFSSFLFICVYDLKHKIVPEESIYLMVLSAVVLAILNGNLIKQLLFGLILFLPFFLIWYFSKGTWMGLGDGKVALSIGLLLPLQVSISAVILSFWIGSLYAIFVILSQKFSLYSFGKKLTIKSELPFIPFMFLGTIIALFFKMDILGLQTLFGI
jgi:leader peptidase (prepilin peptidase) / N-methyltransferase